MVHQLDLQLLKGGSLEKGVRKMRERFRFKVELDSVTQSLEVNALS